MFVSCMFVMLLAWMANFAGLATIIGAFAAGLILHDAYFKYWNTDKKCPFAIKDLIMPLQVILVPIFFVLMGIQVKLEAFNDGNIIILAVSLVFAAIGKSLGVIDDALFSAIVLMVIMTTLMAPPWFKFCLKRCHQL